MDEKVTDDVPVEDSNLFNNLNWHLKKCSYTSSKHSKWAISNLVALQELFISFLSFFVNKAANSYPDKFDATSNKRVRNHDKVKWKQERSHPIVSVSIPNKLVIIQRIPVPLNPIAREILVLFSK